MEHISPSRLLSVVLLMDVDIISAYVRSAHSEKIYLEHGGIYIYRLLSPQPWQDNPTSSERN